MVSPCLCGRIPERQSHEECHAAPYAAPFGIPGASNRAGSRTGSDGISGSPKECRRKAVAVTLLFYVFSLVATLLRPCFPDAVALSRWRILGGSVEDFRGYTFPLFPLHVQPSKIFFEKMHKTSCNLKNSMVQYRRKRQKASEACLPKRRPQRVLQGPPGQLWR